MILGLDFVMLHVPDIEKARTFYTEKLGFAVEDQMPGFVQFKKNGEFGAIFALQEDKGVAPHRGVELWWIVDNADATYAALVSRDVEVVSQPAGPLLSKTRRKPRSTCSSREASITMCLLSNN